MAINTGKIVAGGLLAGVVFNVGDFLINTVLLAQQSAEMMRRLGLDPTAFESPSAMVPWIVIDFMFGLLVVWTYAAIRPRFGPGVTTAVMAGLIPFLGATLVLGGFTSMGLFTLNMFVMSSIASLVNTIVGSIAGAWAYTEL